MTVQGQSQTKMAHLVAENIANWHAENGAELAQTSGNIEDLDQPAGKQSVHQRQLSSTNPTLRRTAMACDSHSLAVGQLNLDFQHIQIVLTF